MHSVSEDHGFAERQTRLRAVPLNEFVNSMPVAALTIGTRIALHYSTDRLGAAHQPCDNEQPHTDYSRGDSFGLTCSSGPTLFWSAFHPGGAALRAFPDGSRRLPNLARQGSRYLFGRPHPS